MSFKINLLKTETILVPGVGVNEHRLMCCKGGLIELSLGIKIEGVGGESHRETSEIGVANEQMLVELRMAFLFKIWQVFYPR